MLFDPISAMCKRRRPYMDTSSLSYVVDVDIVRRHHRRSSALHGPVLGTRLFADERFVDVRNDATAGDRCLDETVQLLVTTDGELQMSGRDSLYFEILGSVSRQLEHLSSQVFQDSRTINSSGGADSSVRRRPRLEMSMNSADGELETGFSGPGHGLGLHFTGILACFAACHFRFCVF